MNGKGRFWQLPERRSTGHTTNVMLIFAVEAKLSAPQLLPGINEIQASSQPHQHVREMTVTRLSRLGFCRPTRSQTVGQSLAQQLLWDRDCVQRSDHRQLDGSGLSLL